MNAVKLLPMLVLAMIAACSGCSNDDPPPVQPLAANQDEREQKATTLWVEARSAEVATKLDLFRRIIALYPDTKKAQESYLELVVYLVRETPPLLEEGLRHAKAFADRHPDDLRWSECFVQVCDTAYRLKDEKIHAAGLAAWSDLLEKHDVLGDVAKEKILPELAGVRLRQQRWKDADVMIDSALGVAGVPAQKRVELLVRQGNLRAAYLDRKDDARQSFNRALELAREVQKTAKNNFGYLPEDIEAEIAKLGP